MIALNAWPRQNGTGGERPRDHKPLPCDDIARNHKISPCKEPPVALRTIAFARYATPRPHCPAGGNTRAPKAPPPTAPPDTPPPPQPLRSPANSPQAPAAPPIQPPRRRARPQARPPSRQIARPTASESPGTRRDTTGYLRSD